jgi:pyruvate dehydrogenase E2 component (dihydrolipoamide acetyltransferase)
MPELLRMPEVATDTSDAVLVNWVVAENARFAAQDSLAVIETAKAAVDIAAEADGVLLRVLAPVGTQVSVGTPLALLAAIDERVDDIDAALTGLGLGRVEPGARQAPVPDRGDRKGALALEIPEADPEPSTGLNHSGGANHSVRLNGAAPPRIFASPLARRLARDAELGLDELTGTGPHQRIVRRDVEAAIQARSRPVAPAPAVQPAVQPTVMQPTVMQPRPTARTPDPSRDGVPARVGAPFSEMPHSRRRAAIAARLTQSKQTTPHFYLRGRARVDDLLQLRQRLNADSPVRISVNDLVIKAVAAAHLAVPAMNVTWGPDAVRQYSQVDVAVAVAVDGGLVTPVITGVESRSVSSVARAVAEFAARAHDGGLQQHELEGGTITVTNLGMFGTEEFAAIINPPQASILAVGAARAEPFVAAGELCVATVLHVTLSVDHRPVDGTTAAQWMSAFIALLENPLRLLA